MPSACLVGLLVFTFVALIADGFVVGVLRSEVSLGSSISASCNRRQCTSMMAAERSQKRRRKKSSAIPRGDDVADKPVKSADGENVQVSELNVSGGTKYDPDLAQLFTDDWSGMATPKGLKKVEKKILEKQELPDMTDFKSQLTPISQGKRERELSAAEKFEEGSVIKTLKAGAWAAILSGVAWEIYLHSPFFKPPGAS